MELSKFDYLTKGQPKYEVEKVLDHMKMGKKGTYDYLLKFKGYDTPEWVPDHHMYCTLLKEQYWQRVRVQNQKEKLDKKKKKKNGRCQAPKNKKSSGAKEKDDKEMNEKDEEMVDKDEEMVEEDEMIVENVVHKKKSVAKI